MTEKSGIKSVFRHEPSPWIDKRWNPRALCARYSLYPQVLYTCISVGIYASTNRLVIFITNPKDLISKISQISYLTNTRIILVLVK